MKAQPAGVVVTFFPDEAFASRLAAIARETNPVIVVDNSADECVRSALRQACGSVGAEFVPSPANVGLAAALNLAGTILASRAVEWLIAFDQDSTPDPGLAESLLAAQSVQPAAVIVGANWQEEARDRRPSRQVQRHRAIPFLFQRVEARHDLDDVTFVITSGTLFHLPTVRQLGGFDESLFLDLVDTDLCLRATRAGHRIRVAASAKLAHRRGAKRPVTLFGRTFWAAFTPEPRLFYVFRNRVVLARRYACRYPHWAVYEVTHSLKMLAEILFLEDRKLAKFRACVRGMWHGLRQARPHSRPVAAASTPTSR